MACTYIVVCADGSYYVGSTHDLDRRVMEHNVGVGANYTRKRRPVHLVWFQEFDRISDAARFERQVHGWSRAKKLALIERRHADLPRLSHRDADR
ncbi:GIY-YIG nuclease family protein [Nocardioides terrisoli]|uniref:GIY-YIG nuclease family protein n=1 Tax=Nocardioides terrisoli TaxID=3388267 RepID=UPI00287BA5CB|nr:GIY-YIG nuclease family protein [Nocardioides marmorisolisilvae]